jgi:proline dehydrogenase
MQIVRSALLWASRNARMERLVRRSTLTRPLVSRFMPGETLEEAVVAARTLGAEKTPTILTYLGENVRDDAAGDQSLAEYNRMLDVLGRDKLETQVSIKLTQFGWDVDRARAMDRVRRLVSRARAQGMLVPIDMESSEYVTPTIEAFAQLRGEFDNVALCLQAYLHRTPQDLQRLLPLRPTIRLVKGAYRESATVALQDRGAIDARYRELAATLLDNFAAGARAVFGTHDSGLIALVRADARARGIAESSYEIQMLYGIQDGARRALAAQGVPTRVLISYGRAWYPWFMRRLAEKPSNLLLAGRSLFSRG